MRTAARAIACSIALICFAGTTALAQDAEMWPSLRKEIFGAAPIAEEDAKVALEAPYRAEDAALVPLTISIPAEAAASAKRLTLIVDDNPSPVVATFTFGPAAGTGERILSTRVRIDRYSNVRAVVEMNDGSLHMTTKFVKASGGCSAPAGKDPDEALAGIGRMQITPAVAGASPSANLAQIMIKHPNYTGMQMDQVTRNYTPARFVSEMEVKDAGTLVFRMTGGISISENPHFRFTYPKGRSGSLDVTATDSDGATFAGKSNPNGS